jgi:YihY family inner membrane protein
MQLIQDLRNALWAPAPPGRGQPLRAAVHAGRIVDRLVDDLYTGRLNLYAMSLVYTTVLSIVPVLAVSFSVLKAFGVHNQLEPTLHALLAPLGERGGEITQQIIVFVDNIQVGVLGALGLGFLIYTVISLLQKVEESFNFIWKSRGERSLSRRFSDYLSVLLVGPVLVFTALGITGAVMGSDAVQWVALFEPARTLIAIAGRVVPFLLIVAAFTFIYKVVPYTRVDVRAAFTGAVVAALLWQVAGLAFASVVAQFEYHQSGRKGRTGDPPPGLSKTGMFERERTWMYLQRPWGRVPGPARPQPVFDFKLSHYPPEAEDQLEKVLAMLMSGSGGGRREYPRLAQRLEIYFDDPTDIRATLEDISRGGLAVTVPYSFQPGQSVQLTVFGGAGVGELRLRARVVNQTVVEEGKLQLYRIGLKFEHPSAALQEIVNRLLQKLTSRQALAARQWKNQ